MNNKNFILRDLKSVASGFASTFSSIKLEIDKLVQSKVEKILNSKGYVTREDFHALEDRFNKLETEFVFLKKTKKRK